MISLNSKITRKVLSFFFLNIDAELYLNEMARKFDVDRANLSRKLSEWEQQGILYKRKKGNLSLYKINKKYPMFREMQKIIQKSFGIEYDLKNIFVKNKKIKQAFIFGSYASDKLGAESDIDLLIVGSHDGLKLQKEILKLQKKFDREINTIDMTEAEFEEKKSDDLINNILSSKNIKLL